MTKDVEHKGFVEAFYAENIVCARMKGPQSRLQSFFEGSPTRFACFREASMYFVVTCKGHYKVFFKEALHETQVCSAPTR